MPDPDRLTEAVTRCLPDGVCLGQADPLYRHALLPGEEAGPQAIARRIDEFSAGRAAARLAMAPFGHAATALPMGQDRAPIWPVDVTGSISHSNRACLAIAGRRAEWAGLGLDIERDTALDPALWPEVLRPEERDGLLAMPAADRGLHALAVFCAKEAAYKAQYALSRTMFGFEGLSVVMVEGRFHAVFRTAIAPFAEGAVIEGRIVCAEGHMAALAFLPA